MTVRVLSVLAEQLLKHVGGDELQISDEQLSDPPDLIAWRDEERAMTFIKIKR